MGRIKIIKIDHLRNDLRDEDCCKAIKGFCYTSDCVIDGNKQRKVYFLFDANDYSKGLIANDPIDRVQYRFVEENLSISDIRDGNEYEVAEKRILGEMYATLIIGNQNNLEERQ